MTMRQSKRNQILLTGGVLAALVGLLTVNAGAMHIAEGYLPGELVPAVGRGMCPLCGGGLLLHQETD